MRQRRQVVKNRHCAEIQRRRVETCNRLLQTTDKTSTHYRIANDKDLWEEPIPQTHEEEKGVQFAPFFGVNNKISLDHRAIPKASCIMRQQDVVNAFLALLLQTAFFQSMSVAQAKDMSNDERHQIDVMLSQVSTDVAKHYYDPKLHGVDWHAKISIAREQVKQEKSLNMAMAHIAAALDSLNDSHTFLIPPRRPYVLDHGWTIEMIGDKCFVTHVRPGEDAETHGVKPGDQVLAINGYHINRYDLWKIEFAFDVLRPLPQLVVTLRDPERADRKVGLEAKFHQRAHVKDLDANTVQNMELDEEVWAREQEIRMVEYGDDLLIAKLPSFMFAESELDKLVSKARNHKAMILDLRQNRGGNVELVKSLIGSLFDHDVKIYNRVARDSTKAVVAKVQHHPFDGKLVVLIDSKSASASEILARIVQLEKRGTVIGDRSSGSVMEARRFEYSSGIDIVMFYGASITEADLIMTDGKSLEHVGVIPDEEVLPTADDLSSGRDPTLALAAELVGLKITPESAGKLFPYKWPKYQ
jgi:carboxyl-terminal processing protease